MRTAPSPRVPVRVHVRKALHLVGAKQAPEPGNTRLVLGDYIADVLLDTRFDAEICHWIVQRVGSPEIVAWGQERTFDDAKSAAQSCLETLNAENKRA
jgi:hypothetical protein